MGCSQDPDRRKTRPGFHPWWPPTATQMDGLGGGVAMEVGSAGGQQTLEAGPRGLTAHLGHVFS